MTSYTNGSPQAVLLGANDKSKRSLVIEREKIATHTPLIYTFAQTGPVGIPQLVMGDSAIRTFGENTFITRSKFFTHQSLIYKEVAANGQASVFLQRVLPDDAPPPAGFMLCVDLLAQNVTLYQRNSDGTIVRDVNGVAQPVMSGGNAVTVPGYTARFFTRAIPQVNAAGVVITQTMKDDYASGNTSIDIKPIANVYGSMSPYVGTRSVGQTVSTVYPIMEVADSFEGEDGNLKGMQLWAKTALTAGGVDDSVVAFNKAFMYGMRLVRKDTPSSTPYILKTKDGLNDIEFCFKEGAYNPKTDMELWADEHIVNDYQELNDPGAVPLYAPFGNLHIYYDHIEVIGGLIQATESVQDSNFPNDADERYLVNFIGATHTSGAEYHTYQILGPSSNGLMLNEYSTIYAMNGGDGTCTFQTFDDLVAREAANFGDLKAPLLDMAQYPLSVVYDSGFSLPTKRKLYTIMSRRKDVNVVTATQVFTDAPNTTAEESSLATALSVAARLFPESEAFGTPVVRASVVGHCGKMINSDYKGYVPLTVDLAGKMAKYMGSGDKTWDSQNSPDDTNKLVTNFRDVNCTWKPNATNTRDWGVGLIRVQYFDRRRLMYPGLRTAYPDDTSVFNNLINAFILGDLEKVCFETWAELTGNSRLTPDQFNDKSDRIIAKKINERGSYDGRVVVRPRTVTTSVDANNGFSWTTYLDLYANNGKTVGVYSINGFRKSDLQA